MVDRTMWSFAVETVRGRTTFRDLLLTSAGRIQSSTLAPFAPLSPLPPRNLAPRTLMTMDECMSMRGTCIYRYSRPYHSCRCTIELEMTGDSPCIHIIKNGSMTHSDDQPANHPQVLHPSTGHLKHPGSELPKCQQSPVSLLFAPPQLSLWLLPLLSSLFLCLPSRRSSTERPPPSGLKSPWGLY